MAAGFGLSLVNLTPEEVIFASFSHIRFFYQSTTDRSSSAEIRIGSVQIDNQLFGTAQPVSLFVAQPVSLPSSSASPRGSSSRSDRDRVDLRVYVKFEKDPDYGFLVFKVL